MLGKVGVGCLGILIVLLSLEGALQLRVRVVDPSAGPRLVPDERLGLPRPKAEWATSGTPAGEGVKILAIFDRHGLPLSVSTYAAHHEVTWIPLSFNCYMLEVKPEHLVGDRAYHNDGLDDDLKQDGINMIAPHRSTRKLKTQDGRHLRRYQRRRLVDRFFGWLQWKRRLLVRWEYDASNFLGFVQLASITRLLKQF